MPLGSRIANLTLSAGFYPAHLRFQQVLSGGAQAVQAAQEKLLLSMLRQNAQTEFGRRHHFSDISSAKSYQEAVPLSSYEDYAADIERICAGEQNILTTEPALLLEPTSGSSTAQKLIPYTKTLKQQFQAGIQPWLYNLYKQTPGLSAGKSYWSITPVGTSGRRTTGGIPIGFEEDSAYLGQLSQSLLHFVFAVPSGVAHLKSSEEFYFQTARALLACDSLSLISVWNPTFFLLILDFIQSNRASLLAALPRARAAKMEGALAQKDYAAVWKRLRLVSCWSDANAAPYAQQLAKQLPHAALQPKGLLSTEGFTSFPLGGESGARLSVLSHFFEFLPANGGIPRFAWELTEGEEYEVILTTGSGFYRYQTGDRILVLGDCGGVARLRFLGRCGNVCDLFGEKLNERFVEQTVRRLAPEADFFLLAPDTDRYVLYIKTNKSVPNIDQALRENFHYDYCRKLGQLKPAAVYRLTGNPAQEYLEACVHMGQRLGDVKPLFLSAKDGWEKYLKGVFM